MASDVKRYFVELSYLGTHYHGWQRQPNKISVQETVENAFSTVLRNTITVFGCGRTDTGVHASQYFCHFDIDKELPIHFLQTINRLLPKDIAIKQLILQYVSFYKGAPDYTYPKSKIYIVKCLMLSKQLDE